MFSRRLHWYVVPHIVHMPRLLTLGTPDDHPVTGLASYAVCPPDSISPAESRPSCSLPPVLFEAVTQQCRLIHVHHNQHYNHQLVKSIHTYPSSYLTRCAALLHMSSETCLGRPISDGKYLSWRRLVVYLAATV
ncbi:hypothetical protein L210DRAFT_3017777 [Boletus edulis BED1]|uniref:Uncharacterized protein n=1 Tax=Boletus edulis BED1 TaxID=1328754 RepID=A0AAD4BHM5_BOLED|nr:hypothetical protein L210DRAFT_3017777 [Boletus edulis BED1]